MKILTSAEMRAADQATFSTLLIPSLAVMESAGRAVARVICEVCADRLEQGVLVVAGRGNNGGDGFVVARTLGNLGINTIVLSLNSIDRLSGDAALCAKSYLNSGGEVWEYSAEDKESILEQVSAFAPGTIVDAIFGSGFTGTATGEALELINLINESSAIWDSPVVAIDLPSGVECDSGQVSGGCVQAQITVALQCLKLAHVLFPGTEYCGEILVADIGIGNGLPEVAQVGRELITEMTAQHLLESVFNHSPEAHKGNRGHLLLLGGSSGHFGAIKLSGQAALKAGAGLATLLFPKIVAEQVSPELHELMCASLPDDGIGGFSHAGLSKLEAICEGKNALVVGPGWGQDDSRKELLKQIFVTATKQELPLLLDADAINILAASPELLKELPVGTVLTPHPGEMVRLTGGTIDKIQLDRIGVAKEWSEKLGCIIVLKGARTIIASPEGQVWVNPAATPVLATAGSGDVLAGIIGAFLANGLLPIAAAIAGTFVHGVCGELLIEMNQGEAGVVAGDIISTIPQAINLLLSQPLTDSGQMLRMVLPGSLHGLEFQGT